MMIAFLLTAVMANTGQSTPAQPLGNPGLWVGTTDYPAAALRQMQQGTTSIRLTIDALGRVSACDIVESSGFEQLDQQACTLASRRARFSPAKDAAGNAVSGSYQNRVAWRIPQDSGAGRINVLNALPTGPRGNWLDLHSGKVADTDPLRTEMIASPAIGFTLDIGVDGAVGNCTVTDANISAPVADATCRQLKSVKMIPARDIDDQPTMSRYKGDFRWRAAGLVNPPAARPQANRFANGKATVDFTLGTDGMPGDCKLSTEGTNPFGGAPRGPCDSGRPIEPFRDANGNAVARHVRLVIAIEVAPAKDTAASAPSAAPKANE
jgi:TonB family protein